MLEKLVKFAFIIIFGYLLGNISTAKILSRLKKDDITKHGSGNPGTMNMLRTFGFKFGILTLLFDALKGAIPSLLGMLLFKQYGIHLSTLAIFIGGFSAVIGHIFPAFYKFKGGKGVACVVGMFAVAEPLWALVMFAVCFVYLIIFKYGALASFIFITALTIIEGYKYRESASICLILFGIFFLTWFVHRQNFFRLLIGKENKVNLFKKKNKEEKINKQEKKELQNKIKNKEIG